MIPASVLVFFPRRRGGALFAHCIVPVITTYLSSRKGRRNEIRDTSIRTVYKSISNASVDCEKYY